jgi:hypothetical protein
VETKSDEKVGWKVQIEIKSDTRKSDVTKAGLRTKEKMSQKIKVEWVGRSGRNKVKREW